MIYLQVLYIYLRKLILTGSFNPPSKYGVGDWLVYEYNGKKANGSVKNIHFVKFGDHYGWGYSFHANPRKIYDELHLSKEKK